MTVGKALDMSNVALGQCRLTLLRSVFGIEHAQFGCYRRALVLLPLPLDTDRDPLNIPM